MHAPKFPFYTEPQFKQALLSGQVIDAMFGGLIIGRSHSQGNIYLVKYENGLYITFGNMEGGEYVLSQKTYQKYKAEIIEINNDEDTDKQFLNQIPIGCKMHIDTRRMDEDNYLWFDEHGMFIINKYSTYKHFDRLQEMNWECK